MPERHDLYKILKSLCFYLFERCDLTAELWFIEYFIAFLFTWLPIFVKIE